MSESEATGDRVFRASAAAALALHAFLLARNDGLQGGADLQAHLRLMQLMAEAPGLRNPYAPAYHVLGALLAPALGYAVYTKAVAFLSAAGLIAGFRCFQRASGAAVRGLRGVRLDSLRLRAQRVSTQARDGRLRARLLGAGAAAAPPARGGRAGARARLLRPHGGGALPGAHRRRARPLR